MFWGGVWGVYPGVFAKSVEVDCFVGVTEVLFLGVNKVFCLFGLGRAYVSLFVRGGACWEKTGQRITQRR
jgi:hypothetical protein